ncbi:MAG: ATP-binding cassette domain-containing protein, partial [Mycobacterium sp.]
MQITSLSKAFAGVQVLRDVSFDIEPGEVHALLGQNGSGKSTIIKCLAGVHKPDSASIEVGGRALPHQLRPER